MVTKKINNFNVGCVAGLYVEYDDRTIVSIVVVGVFDGILMILMVIL